MLQNHNDLLINVDQRESPFFFCEVKRATVQTLIIQWAIQVSLIAIQMWVQNILPSN